MRSFHRNIPIIAAVFAALLASDTTTLHGQAAPAAPATAAAQPAAPVLVAKFEKLINTKSAKVGDPITAKTVKDLKLKDLDIPKGSKIVGSVASVQSMKAGGGTSVLAVKFDHVELKSGAVLRAEGQIVGIGPAPDPGAGLGYSSVLGRGGVGSTPGLDPSIGAGTSKDEIPQGSSMEGVALGLHLTAAGATELHGVHRDIKVDNDTMIKVALFRTA
jgi:hypothetical protein